MFKGRGFVEAYRSDEHLIVERDGFPVAVILSYQEYEKLKPEPAVADYYQSGQGANGGITQPDLSEEWLPAELDSVQNESAVSEAAAFDQMSLTSLAELWDNEEDAIYDNWQDLREVEKRLRLALAL